MLPPPTSPWSVIVLLCVSSWLVLESSSQLTTCQLQWASTCRQSNIVILASYYYIVTICLEMCRVVLSKMCNHMLTQTQIRWIGRKWQSNKVQRCINDKNQQCIEKRELFASTAKVSFCSWMEWQWRVASNVVVGWPPIIDRSPWSLCTTLLPVINQSLRMTIVQMCVRLWVCCKNRHCIAANTVALLTKATSLKGGLPNGGFIAPLPPLLLETLKLN